MIGKTIDDIFRGQPKAVRDTITETINQTIPSKESAQKALGENMYDTIYKWFLGDYDPNLEGLVLPPTLLNDLNQSFS